MNTSGEAADQVVRMALQTGEVALKITGEGAKQLAVLLYAILKEQKKSKGKARMETLVRTGKPLTVYSVKESDIKEFVKEAKRYGVLYCAVRNPRRSKDGMVDVIVKQEDASRIKETVYQHLANEIFFCILHEEYALGAKLPSYIDLAKEAGSSPEIVRKVSWESQRQGIKDKREVS